MRISGFYGHSRAVPPIRYNGAETTRTAMRKKLRKILPDHEAVRGNRWLAPFENTLLHPRLWHLNRHSAAGGVAVGLFCGLIPGPFQMLGAAICAVIFRVNLPLALFTTLYTNPFTIVPLYFAAYGLGRLVPGAGGGEFVAPPEWGTEGMWAWVLALADWMAHLGKPLALGLVLLASLLAAAGYFVVRVAWRSYLLWSWRLRRRRRSASRPD
jgi:uncharacterized protein (DUF2062 family)